MNERERPCDFINCLGQEVVGAGFKASQAVSDSDRAR
jgi:hypothetical protein